MSRIFAEHPAWSVLAIRAPARDLAPKVALWLGSERWFAEAANRPLDESVRDAYLLQLRGHAWSLLLGTALPRWPLRLSETAQELAARVASPVVAFGREETGGSAVARLFEPGGGGRAARGRGSWSKFFRELELFVPFHACWSSGGRSQLVLEGLARASVEALSFYAECRRLDD